MRYYLTSLILVLFNTASVHAQPCDPIETAKLLAIDGAPDDKFGNSVSISGDTAIVGAPADFGYTGSAYVFENVDGIWNQVAELLAPDGSLSDGFGDSVSISGDTAIVGAPGDDDLGNESGSIHVFEKINGVWTHVTKLLPSDGAEADFFGSSVSLSDDTAIVGADGDDDHGESSGSAYVFEKVNGVWTQVAKLLAPDGDIGDHFGAFHSLSGGIAIVGAWADDDLGEDFGSAYIFEKIDGHWTHVAKILPSDGAASGFGPAVALSGEIAVVGAPSDNNRGERSGAAYLFEKVNGTWTQQAKLFAFDGAEEDRFGFSVAIDNGIVGVGASFDDDRGSNSGSAYVFKKVGTVWTHAAKILASDAKPNVNFGNSISISGNHAVVGAPVNFRDSGAAYVFDLHCDNPNCLDLTVQNLVAGENATFITSGGKPGAKALTAYSLERGKTSINNFGGYCATFGININQNNVIGGFNRQFDANGEITFQLKIPEQSSGQQLFFQSAQRGTCPDECMSYLVQATIQ